MITVRALLALALLVVLSACEDFHWVEGPPVTIEPRVAPVIVELPTVTPTPQEETE